MSLTDQAMQYYQLVQQGMPPAQAYKQAFPNGLPTKKDREKKAAKGQQSNALGAVAGTLTGALATQAAIDAVKGDSILGLTDGTKAPKATTTDTPKTQPPTAPVHSGAEAAAQGAQAGGADTATAQQIGGLIESGQVQTVPQGQSIPDGYQQIGQNADGGAIVASDAAAESGTNWGQIGQYLGYAVAAYQAYDTWKNRDDLTDKQEALGYTQAGTSAANVYAGGNPYLSAAGAALNIYGTYDNDNLTSEEQAARAQQQAGAAVLDYMAGGIPVGTALDMGLQSTGFGRDLTEFNAKYSPISQGLAAFGSSKGKEQMARDRVRGHLEKMGVINKNLPEGAKKDWSIKFGDNSSFDIGKDGGARLTNGAGERRQYSDVDFGDQYAGSVVGAVNPLAAILTGGDKRLRSDTAGWYTNAVLNGAPDEMTANVRIKDLYAQHGIDQATANQLVDDLLKKERIDADTAAAYKNGVNDVFNGTPTLTKAPQPEGQDMISGQRLVQALGARPVNKPVGQPGAQGQAVMQGQMQQPAPSGQSPQWMPPQAGQVDPRFNQQPQGQSALTSALTNRLPQQSNPAQAAFTQPQPRQISAVDQQRMNQMINGAQQQGRRLTPQEQWRVNQIRGTQ